MASYSRNLGRAVLLRHVFVEQQHDRKNNVYEVKLPNTMWSYIILIYLQLTTTLALCSAPWTGLFANDISEGFEPLPLVVSDTSVFTLFSLSANGNLLLNEQEEIWFYCQFGLKEQPGVLLAKQVCLNSRFIESWPSFLCKQPNENKVERDYEQTHCEPNEEKWNIIVPLPNSQTHTEMILCFEREIKSTNKVSYTIYAASASVFYVAQRPYDRWSNEQYDNFLVAKAYTYRQQQWNLQTFFEGAEHYWQNNALQRGHLATFNAGMYFLQRNATCEYVNNSPQWASVNMGNMMLAEKALANLAKITSTNLAIEHYNGVQLELPDSYGGIHKLALLPEVESPFGLVHVPEFMFKVFKEPINNMQLIAFVSNNPFERTPGDICEDIGMQFTWWPYNSFHTGTDDDYRKGYTLLCKFNDILFQKLKKH